MNPLPKRTDASQFDSTGRTRAISATQIRAGAIQNLTRNHSLLSPKSSLPNSRKRFAPGLSPLELSDKPNRTRKAQRDASGMDNIITNGLDDEKPESHTLSSPITPMHPKISKSARDLIEFLDQGPPVDFVPPQVASSPKSTGRFQRMMSRLTGSSSSEKLREDGARLRKASAPSFARNATNGTLNPPQNPVKMPAVIVASPPPRPPSMMQQITPPDSPPTINQDSLRPVQRRTSVRKKVPPLDPELETPGLAPPPSPFSRITPNDHPHSQTLTDGNGQLNGADKPVSPPSSPEPEPRVRGSVDTISSDGKITFRRPTPTPLTTNTAEVVTPAPASLPVTIQPPSPSQRTEPSLDVTHAQSLRQLMSMATTADECRVLVDMFLARVGFPIDRSTNMDPYPSPISSTDPSDVDLEGSVVETLLGGDSSSDPSTTFHSTQPSEASQADESEVGTSDAETFDEDINPGIQRSPSNIAQLDRPPLPTTRLLTVA